MMSSQHPSLTLEGFALAAHVPVSKLARYSSTKEGKALELGSKKRIDTAKMCYGLYLFKTPQPMEVLVVSSDFSKGKSVCSSNPKSLFNSSTNKDGEVML
ncbi:hypothetical protein ZIOFF_028607 [Zingiber officinale]|uniref:Uncharacterized protein n=1 Tax=Zingiber officinale TaxID=94328 RepID=A0A8J5LDY4_ZINOF|nr:hypothetical protein ZIOFF_028607 [Zingiber officinale]